MRVRVTERPRDLGWPIIGISPVLLREIITKTRTLMQDDHDMIVSVSHVLGEHQEKYEDEIASRRPSEVTPPHQLVLCPLVDNFDRQIFSVVIASQAFKSFGISGTLDVNSVEEMLRMAIPVMQNLQSVDLYGIMTEPDAGRILAVLQTCTSLVELDVSLANTGLLNTIQGFLRECTSLRRLKLSMREFSGAVFVAACEGIRASTSLQSITTRDRCSFDHMNVDMFGEAMASAICDSESVTHFESLDQHVALFNSVRGAILRSQDSQDFQVRTKHYKKGQYLRLEIERSIVPWRYLLQQDVPLNYWSKILARAVLWNPCDFTSRNASHTCHDAVFILLRERLFQNNAPFAADR